MGGSLLATEPCDKRDENGYPRDGNDQPGTDSASCVLVAQRALSQRDIRDALQQFVTRDFCGWKVRLFRQGKNRDVVFLHAWTLRTHRVVVCTPLVVIACDPNAAGVLRQTRDVGRNVVQQPV